MTPVPANTKHLHNICTTSAQRLRRWTNIIQMLYICFVLAGMLRCIQFKGHFLMMLYTCHPGTWFFLSKSFFRGADIPSPNLLLTGIDNNYMKHSHTLPLHFISNHSCLVILSTLIRYQTIYYITICVLIINNGHWPYCEIIHYLSLCDRSINKTFNLESWSNRLQ